MKRDNGGSQRHGLPVESLEQRVLASQAPWSPAMLDAEAHSGATVAQDAAPSPEGRGMAAAATHPVSASTGRTAPPSKAGFDYPTFIKMVKPLKHGLGANAPIVLWGWPPPAGNIQADQINGTLRTYIDGLAARGIDPQLPVGPNYFVGNTVALAQTLEAANLPVYLVFPRYDMISGTAYQNTTVFGTYTDPSGKVYQYPCLPLADGSIGAQWVHDQLLPLQQAGIHVTGVLFDDESYPSASGIGLYESQEDPACASYYPAGALDTFQTFWKYTFDLRSTLEGQIMGDPVHQLFPGAVVGDFGSYQSSAAVPFMDIRNNNYPPRQLDIDAQVDALYNQSILLPQDKAPAKPTAKWADSMYFSEWVRSISSAASNRGSTQLYTFVSSDIPGTINPPNLQFMESRGAYKEALRHLWLRGVNSLWLFAGGDSSPSQAVAAFHMMDDSRAVYDGLLAYRNFLTQGTPMNVTMPDASGTQPIWSGLKLGDQALVRTYSPSGKAGRVTVDAFPGVTVTLPATAAGAGFLISSNGHIRRVKM